MKNGGAAHHTMKALRIIGITQNASPLREGAGRRPGIECLEEAQLYAAIRMSTELRLFLVTKNLGEKSDTDSLFTDT